MCRLKDRTLLAFVRSLHRRSQHRPRFLPRVRGQGIAFAIAAVHSLHVAAAPDVQPANAAGALGLYPATDFRLTTGACEDCSAIRQARWYFRNEPIAVPLPGLPMSAFDKGIRAFDDVDRWSRARASGAGLDYPALVWTGAPDIVRGARLAVDGKLLVTDNGSIPFRPVAKIPLNRSYYDASSIEFFNQRPLTVRGFTDDSFVGRVIWPEDFRLGGRAPAMQTLPAGTSASEGIRSLMRAEPQGGARSPYATSTLWQRDGAPSEWAGRPVLALMVNGAQGDDDEALGGHFAIVTGRVQPDGRISDWLVNNFYSLDVESEKGILAAPVPLDSYIADLNSGQGWYRPSYMLVAILRDDRGPILVQSALNRVYNQFWRHQLVYYHPDQNCASISIDTLRALGWDVPHRGPSNRWLAWLAFPFVAIKELSFVKAKAAFDYLRTDQTRLLPAAALEEAFGSLLSLGNGGSARGDGALAQMLAQDLDALVFVRFPQFPSSRKFGDAPAVTVFEYRTRVPDPEHAQIVPVPPRPFPDELRDSDLLPPPRHFSDYAMLVWVLLTVVGLPLLVWRLWRRWRARRDAATP